MLSIVIPMYNEKPRIASSVETIRAYLETLQMPYEIIVVDDGSTDGSAAALADVPDVCVISYQPNRGKGNAVRQGMLAAKGDLVAFSDVDLSAPIEELRKLLDAIESGADIAIGSRALPASQLVVHQPKYRELGGKMLNLVIRALSVKGIHDTQCGFKLFRGEVARRLFAQCILDGWGFDVEVLYLAQRMGYRIAEVPVKWAHSPDSRIHPFRAGLQVIKDLFRIRLHRYQIGNKDASFSRDIQ